MITIVGVYGKVLRSALPCERMRRARIQSYTVGVLSHYCAYLLAMYTSYTLYVCLLYKNSSVGIVKGDVVISMIFKSYSVVVLLHVASVVAQNA